MKNNILNVEKLAEMFDLKESTIREWINTGKIPAKKIGKRWYTTETAVEHALLSNNPLCPSCGEEMYSIIENVGFTEPEGPSHYSSTGKLSCPNCGGTQTI